MNAITTNSMEIIVDGKSIYECSTDEMKEVNKVVKLAWGLAQQKEALKFKSGDIVQFEHKKRMITGTIIGINQKSISVKTETTRWTVSPGLLSKVEG